MKTLMAAIVFATLLAAPAFAQSVHAWGWKGGVTAPTSATSAFAAASFDGRRGALSGRRGALPSWRSSTCSMPCNCNASPASPSYRTNCN
jgi:hypothetical protein